MRELRIEESHLDGLVNRIPTYSYITRIYSHPLYNVIVIQRLSLSAWLPSVKYYWSEKKGRTLICKMARHNPELMQRLLIREIRNARPESPATLPSYYKPRHRRVAHELHRD